MSSAFDDFRAKAKAKSGTPVFHKTQGWSFGLSYGPVTERSVPPEVLEVAKHVLAAFPPEHREGDVPPDEWMLSAKLFPPGRSSDTQDWAYLGKVLAAMRVPVEAQITPFETTDPNSTHYWIWKDPS